MESDPLIYREEVTAILEVLADINVNIARIARMLEEGLGEIPEDDA
jgi:hypothetical protein